MLSKSRTPGAALPVGTGRTVEMTFEDLGQMALMRKTTFAGYLRQRQLGLLEQPLCPLEALAQHKLVRTGSRCLSEQLSKVVWTEANLLG